MRRRKADLRRRVNADLGLAFTASGLTSYGGIEIFRCYLRRIDFSRRLQSHLAPRLLRGDFAAVSMIKLILVMLILGAHRLRHVAYLQGDPLVSRFSGLRQLPSDRTLSRWLGQCSLTVRRALQRFQVELLAQSYRPLRLPRVTLDIDGTVCSTGLTAERAFRGYNPHHRKSPSYFPITAHLAQTGHILRVQNRAGNVNDGKAAMGFLRDALRDLAQVAPGATAEIRMDGAYFRRDIIGWLDTRAEYAIKVPFYQWVDLQTQIRKQKRWRRVAQDVDGFDVTLALHPWSRTLRVAIYRKRVQHQSPKNYQLDLFDPTDGHWEYSAVATNKTVGIKALWQFMAGRGAHEKVLSELKSGYAFATIPTRNYAANSTWQLLAAMAHNLVVSLQIDTTAQRRRHTAKRSPIFALKRIGTLRFEWICRAGVLQRPAGRQVLKLMNNLPARREVERIVQRLEAA